jgi:transcriptional regulator with XRE-family HTH domain
MSSIIVTYVRRERRSWGLSQKEVAQILGLKSRTQVSRLEHGLAQPTAEQLLALQLLFGLTARQLFPRLSEQARDRVLIGIRSMMDEETTLRAKRKNTLLRQINARANL